MTFKIGKISNQNLFLIAFGCYSLAGLLLLRELRPDLPFFTIYDLNNARTYETNKLPEKEEVAGVKLVLTPSATPGVSVQSAVPTPSVTSASIRERNKTIELEITKEAKRKVLEISRGAKTKLIIKNSSPQKIELASELFNGTTVSINRNETKSIDIKAFRNGSFMLYCQGDCDAVQSAIQMIVFNVR